MSIIQISKDTPVPRWERISIFAFGVTFVAVLLALAFAFPHPTAFQYTTCRIVLALSASAVATLISGFVVIKIPRFAKAGGALAVFIIIFFYSPAALVVDNLTAAARNLDTKHYDVAEQQLRTTLLGNPNNRDALNMLGTLYWRTQKPADALPLFEKAAGLADGDERNRYLHNVSAAAIKLEQFDKAADVLKHVLNRSPGDLAAKYNYGIALAQIGRYSQARDIFVDLYNGGERGFKDYRPTAALQLGLIDLLEGDVGSDWNATAHFRNAVRLDPAFVPFFLHIKTVISEEDFEFEHRLLHRSVKGAAYRAFKDGILRWYDAVSSA